MAICFMREGKAWEQDQWSYLFSNFGITEIWEIGNEGNKDLNVCQPTIKIKTAADLPTDRPLVVLAPQAGRWVKGTESLKDFVHPENAIYMFGGSHTIMQVDKHLGGRVADHYVYIPLKKNECFAHAAGYMTLWDREVKNG